MTGVLELRRHTHTSFITNGEKAGILRRVGGTAANLKAFEISKAEIERYGGKSQETGREKRITQRDKALSSATLRGEETVTRLLSEGTFG